MTRVAVIALGRRADIVTSAIVLDRIEAFAWTGDALARMVADHLRRIQMNSVPGISDVWSRTELAVGST